MHLKEYKNLEFLPELVVEDKLNMEQEFRHKNGYLFSHWMWISK
jgi:hypothetical protein